MLLIALPIFLLSREVLQLWLGQVPEYADIFVKLVMIQELFQVINTGFYTAINAKGQMKENALSAPALLFAAFPVVFFLFKAGFSPVSLSVAYIVSYAVQALIQKPIILVKVVGYKWSDFKDILLRCLVVTVFSSVIPVLYRYFWVERITDSPVILFLSVGVISVACVALASWFLGMDKSMRNKLIGIVLKRTQRD